MKVYINGIGCISPQKTWDSSSFLNEVQEYVSRMIQCIEPEADPGLEDKYLRRMSRLIRLGWTAAKICMNDAGIPQPDAIITGSGWGSVQDSEKFLLSIYKNKENFLPPTPFIQSTHNALGAQIAMLLNSYEYNMTYAHRSFAFEHALQDSLLRLTRGESMNILCGGFDEITPNQFTLYDRLNWWRKEAASNLALILNPAAGSVSGEGFNFFLLQNDRAKNSYASLRWVKTVITDSVPADPEIREILGREEISWVFAGLNGDVENDRILRDVMTGFFPDGVNVAAWKHLSGEYLTSSAFAMWAASKAIKEQRVPEVLRINQAGSRKDIRNILIYNQFKGNQHSFILLSRPD